ncbi:hypothetical protein B0H16DRAFT_1752033 [Mycena metata]|uniref:Uncharacterized protein n=1 Tax=Mycena metata TaxID=1033252 RepID=A0AAD7DLG9_9AGAR|nr:hypothetical protein B0H16DRAFT_1752033 [Mycena metata]
MSSRATTPEDRLSDVFGAMDENSPENSPAAPPRPDKRSHSSVDPASDDEDVQAPPVQVSSILAQNVVLAAKGHGERKRLKPDQLAAVETFLNNPSALREAKIMISIMALENQIDKIVTATAPYQVSADTEKNIKNFAVAVLLSSKCRTYKGQNAIKLVLDLVKLYRGDLAPGVEFNPADWGKVMVCAGDALTQVRSKFKKLIIYSLKPHDTKGPNNAAPADQLNIFQLSEAFVDGTRCSVNVPLCARIALMRKVYLQEPGSKFWDFVDKDLAKIRKRADGDNKKIARAFRHILEADQAKHGSKDYELDNETVDLFQQQVDDLIDAGAADASSIV